jgi:hypothetical protein
VRAIPSRQTIGAIISLLGRTNLHMCDVDRKPGSHNSAEAGRTDTRHCRALLDGLLAWATAPRFVYTHMWRPG